MRPLICLLWLSSLWATELEPKAALAQPALEQPAPFTTGHQETMATVVVQSGDSLIAIGRRLGIPYGRLAHFNPEVQPHLIYPGQKLWYPKGDLRIVVRRQSFMLDLYFGDHLYRSFSVGLGTVGRETPSVRTKLSSSRAERPDYTERDTGLTFPYGHPRHTIGLYWMGFEMGQGYGIHGTVEPKSIGRAMSKGCVRMREVDLELVYRISQAGDEVWIKDE